MRVSNRVIVPPSPVPKTISGSRGSGTSQPRSSPPTGCQSRNVSCPKSLRVAAPAVPRILLAAVDPVREPVVGFDVVELAGRLVVPVAPGLPAVQRDDRALVRRRDHALRVLRVDPEEVVVVAARAAAEEFERRAAVARAPDRLTRHVDDVARARVGGQAVHVARREPGSSVDARPRAAPVVRAPEARHLRRHRRRLVRRVDERPDPSPRRRGEADAADRRRRPASPGETCPGAAAVGRLVEGAPRPDHRLEVGEPGIVAGLPQRGVQDRGVLRIGGEIGAARVLVDEEDLAPGPPAVLGPEEPALAVPAEHVAERRDERDVGILRVDQDAPDRARIRQADPAPGGSAVVGPVHPVAGRDVVARLDLARADVDHLRVRWRNRERSDRRRPGAVEDR